MFLVGWLRLFITMIGFAAIPCLLPFSASAAPTAEVAKRCHRYAYVAYPFKRPGAARMSPDRENYFRDCLAKDGEVPAPAAPFKTSSLGSIKE